MINIKPKLKFFLIFLVFFVIQNIVFINEKSYQDKYFLNLSHEPVEINKDQYYRMYWDIQKYGYADSYFFGNKIKIYEGDIYKKDATLFSKTLQNLKNHKFLIISIGALLLIYVIYLIDIRIKVK